MIARALHDRAWQFQFMRYVGIGGFVMVVDVGSFALLIKAGVILALTSTLSFGLAVCVHFTLNKFINFRAHDRAIHEQATTYAIVAFVCWLVTLGAIEAGVRIFDLAPVVAKLVAVAINLPVGFLGHRYLTFGPGILSALRKLGAR